MHNTQSWKQKIPGLHNYYNKLLEHIKVIPKVTLSSSCLWVSFHPPMPSPFPLFQWYTQSKDILINLSMKCWFSAFNAQGSRLIIVVVQLGAVKINVATVEALRKKERQDENSVYYQNWWFFFEFHPALNANVLFCRFFLINLTLCMTKLRVLVLCFSYFTDNSIV
jgi:hypothetical protein